MATAQAVPQGKVQSLLSSTKPLQELSAAEGPAALIAAISGAVALLNTHRHALNCGLQPTIWAAGRA